MDNNENNILDNIDYSAQDILYMLRDLPDACCIFKVLTDPFGTVTDMLFLFVNEKYSSLVGKPSSELIGSTYYSTVSNRDEDWIRLSYQAAFMRQSVINSTYNTQFNKWFEFWAVPVYQKGFCAFIIHDVTAEKRKEESRVINTKSNTIILDCAKALSANDFGKGIKYVLRELGAVLEADRVAVIECNHGEMGEFFGWADRVGGTGLPSKEVFEEYDFFTLWKHQIGEDGIAIIENLSSIDVGESDGYKSVLKGLITNYIVASLKYKGQTIGYLLVDNFSREVEVNIKEVVESISIFISEELKNYRMVQEMTYISSHDDLTELGNRYAFEATVNMIEGMDVSIGVCSVDINGLKLYNEEKGHDYGDQTIKEAAALITSAFKRKFCYRIGGDEFIVIMPQVTQEKFEENVAKLRKKAKNISMAIGAVWSDDIKNVRNLINQADKIMYADKADYYKEHDGRKIND